MARVCMIFEFDRQARQCTTSTVSAYYYLNIIICVFSCSLRAGFSGEKTPRVEVKADFNAMQSGSVLSLLNTVVIDLLQVKVKVKIYCLTVSPS